MPRRQTQRVGGDAVAANPDYLIRLPLNRFARRAAPPERRAQCSEVARSGRRATSGRRGIMSRGLIGAILVGLGCMAGGCSGPVYKHRYRLTLSVETPDGLKTGSSVIEILGQYTKSLDSTGFHTGIVGEAIFVDLGRGRNLLGLISVGTNLQLSMFTSIAPIAFFNNSSKESFIRLTTHSGTVELPSNLIPTLLTFTNIEDPGTASPVDPERLEQNFGQGYRFAGAKLELTHDAITCHIKKKLPWWNAAGRPAGDAIKAWRSRAKQAGIKLDGYNAAELLFTWCKS